MKTNILSLSALLLAVSCSSSRVSTPMGRLITPETQGKRWGGTATGTYLRTEDYAFDFSKNLTNAPMKKDRSGERHSALAELGIGSPLDVIANISTELSLGLKWQVLGDQKNEAKKGSYSVAFLGMASSHSTSTKNSEFFSDSTENVRKIEINQTSTSLGALAGYRPLDFILVYVGSHRLYEKANGKVTTVDKKLQDKNFSYANDAFMHVLGLSYDDTANHFVAKLEFANLTTEWSHTSKKTNNGVSFAIGADW